ncbi:MAG: CehA/McbA family metallohydrolase [Desulfurococcales archaeon]|nr:CehA/McbA family metallohydrolase [Desulfurococcales archaeon]
MSSRVFVGVLAILLLLLPTALSVEGGSSVKAVLGATPIPEGEAISGQDLTIMNEFLAATFAVGTLPPWGVTRGHIIDLSPVVDGVPRGDIIAQFSFPVNGWGNWATYETFEVVENTSERVVVRAVGFWKDIRVEITYTLEAGKNYIYLVTNLTNTGTSTYEDLVSGYAISLKKGWTFTPGFGTGRQYAPVPKEQVGAVEDWVAGYYEDFAVAIYAPYYTHLSTSTGWVDPFTIHTLEPGESRIFEGYLIVEPIGDICKLREDIMEIKGESGGTIRGVVTAGGAPVPNPVIMVFKDEKPYCWGIGDENGNYEITLPPGSYTLQATAKGFGLSSTKSITLEVGSIVTVDFTDVTRPGTVEVTAVDSRTGEPLDALIRISGGEAPIVKYLEVSVVYTDPDDVGRAEFQLPPGTYTIQVMHGAGFISEPVVFENVVVEEDALVSLEAEINFLVDPSEFGWYSADLHHHSDYLDGRTPPKYVIVAQSAAGLDFAFLSDHDYTANYGEMARYAEARGMPFLPSVEVSPNWAHFNPYPLPLNAAYEPIRGKACEMIAEMRSLGAIVVRINHPMTGYFSAWERGEIPGGYCVDWDTAEINGWWGGSDEATLKKMWELWNYGIRKYLTAGSDVHDIWSSPYSGYPRVYAYIEGEPTPEKFALAEKNGRSYITYGPLVLSMNPMPGDTVVTTGNIEVELEIFSADGLAKMEVVSGGEVILIETFNNTQSETLQLSLDLLEELEEKGFAWVQFIIYDKDEDRAITNPFWLVKDENIIISEELIPTVTETMRETVTTTETTTRTTTKTLVETTTIETTEKVTETKTSTVTETEVQETTNTPLLIAVLIIGLIIGAIASRLLSRG